MAAPVGDGDGRLGAAPSSRSGRVASTALTAATVIDRLADADQRRGRRASPAARCRAARCRRSRARPSSRGGAGHHRQPGAGAGDAEQRAARVRQHAPRGEHQPADEQRADHAHVEDVRPERGDAAVGEHERLDDEHHRQHQAGEPWPEQDRRERGAEEVAAGAARDREVEHLGREHERGGDAEQRHAALVEVDARARAGRSRPRRPPGRRRRPRPRCDRKPSGMCMAVSLPGSGAGRRSGSGRSGARSRLASISTARPASSRCGRAAACAPQRSHAT